MGNATIERALTILLVEDDQPACQEIAQCIDEMNQTTPDRLELVGITNNAYKALEHVKDFPPDAIILDLELHQGGGNGLQFLRDLREQCPDVHPYILITTNNSSPINYEYARHLGADFIMFKHQEDYSARNVVTFLHTMRSVIHSHQHTAQVNYETPDQRTRRLTKRIYTELNYVGISPKVVGYQYLADSILLVIDQPSARICSTIGNLYGKTDSSVERAMQNAINKAWSTYDPEELFLHYTARIRSEKGAPTVTEFIHFYANKLRQED